MNTLQTASFNGVISENRPKQAFENFFEIVDNCVDLAFPEVMIKTSSINTSHNPWMSKGLLISRAHKEKLFSKKLHCPSPEKIDKFKKYNIIYKKICGHAKMSFYSGKFKEFSSNSKKTWDTLRDILRTKKRRENIPDFFKNNGKIITESKDIADGFNSFLGGIGPELASSFPETHNSFQNFLGPQNQENFIFSEVTPLLLSSIAGKLKPKTSSGPDNISTKLLKIMLPIITIPVCHIFNLSLQTGFIPSRLKIAKVVCVFKSGDKHLYTNYRPISLLNSFSKLLEKIVAKQLTGFLIKHSILYKHQYGFRQGHSTSHPIIHFLNKIYTSLNKPTSEYTLGIFLDLKKAFDTVDYSILLKKLSHYGLRGVSNDWFKNYLNDRTQYVTINGINSKPQTLHCGVPQGSVLGPLLFLLYINDLPQSTNFLTLLFADDTTFQVSSNNLMDLYESANLELSKAACWFEANKLTLNVSKTKYILFRTKRMIVDFSQFKLSIGTEKVERIGSDCTEKYFKFVGHRLDEFLSWDHHINHVQGKLSSANFAIGNAKNFLSINHRKLLYDSLFRSHLEFGILAWGGVKPSKLDKINKLQKKCVRNVGGKGHRSHTDPLFSKLNILKFADLFQLNCSNFMFQYSIERVPESFGDFFTPMSVPNRTLGYQIDKLKGVFLEQYPSFFLPKMWNSIDIDLKSQEKYKTFVKLLYESFIDKYPPFVRCNELTCPDCHNV